MKSVVHILTFTSNRKTRVPGLPGADFACSIHSYGYTIHPGVSWDGFGPGGNSIHAQSMHRTAESTKMSMTQHQTLRIQPGQIRRVFCWGESTYFVTLISSQFMRFQRCRAFLSILEAFQSHFRHFQRNLMGFVTVSGILLAN